jgi:L-iditol 2-dehydrogenase
MRIAELVAPRRFVQRSCEPPRPAAGELLVRVHAVGVCGSDLHYYAEGKVGDIECVYPQVIGHEPTGTVVEAGDGVTGWSAGDRVAPEPAIYCYHCEFCRRGLHNLCANLRFMSMPPDAGFFRDFVTVPAANVLALPKPLDFAVGTLFEPLAVALHSMRFASISTGETAAVFGAGPIGLLTIAVLKLSGAGRIWVVEPVAARRELALAMGAAAVLDPCAADPAQWILGETGQRGVDAAIDCAAKDNTINQCLRVARMAGRVVITGIPSEVHVPLEFHVMRRKELAYFTVRRSNHNSELALDLLTRHANLFAPLVTHREPVERIGEAFDMLEHYRDGVGKLVIDLA